VTKNIEFATFTQNVMIRTVDCSTPEVHQISSKAGSGINILYLLTGPIGRLTQQRGLKLLTNDDEVCLFLVPGRRNYSGRFKLK